MPDLVITLGGIDFQGFEVPERIAGLGGRQMLTVHQLIGGQRVVDAMGRDDAPLTWEGRFRGVDAVSRARAIDALRVGGASQSLTFGDFAFTVVVDEFVYEIERFYEVPYHLSLVVLTDDSTIGARQTPGVDEMLASDTRWAQSLGASIGDAALSGLLGNVSTAIGAVPGFASATGAQLQSVLAPVAAAQGCVTSLIVQAETTLNSVSAVGGVVPGLPVTTLASNLLGQVSAMTQVANLYSLQNLL